VSHFRVDAPTELVELIRACLCKDPAARPQNGLVLAHSLEKIRARLLGEVPRPLSYLPAISDITGDIQRVRALAQEQVVRGPEEVPAGAPTAERAPPASADAKSQAFVESVVPKESPAPKETKGNTVRMQVRTRERPSVPPSMPDFSALQEKPAVDPLGGLLDGLTTGDAGPPTPRSPGVPMRPAPVVVIQPRLGAADTAGFGGAAPAAQPRAQSPVLAPPPPDADSLEPASGPVARAKRAQRIYLVVAGAVVAGIVVLVVALTQFGSDRTGAEVFRSAGTGTVALERPPTATPAIVQADAASSGTTVSWDGGP
jgi:hypothetical protein